MTTEESSGHRSEATPSKRPDEKAHERRMYLRFGLMIATSTVVMFVLTYTNSFSMDHVRWSEERLYMALLMGAAMALVMLAFMRSMMYKSRTLNLVVVALALVLGGTASYLSRSQALVDDQAYMRGMIPHHSIAMPNARYRDAHVWYDADAKENFTAHKLLIADVVDGRLKAVPRGVMAAGGIMQGARGGIDIPDRDVSRVKSHLAKYNEKMDDQAPWED